MQDLYQQALAAIGMRAADVEVADVDLTIKPTNFLRNPTWNCPAEAAILDRQAAILFE